MESFAEETTAFPASAELPASHLHHPLPVNDRNHSETFTTMAMHYATPGSFMKLGDFISEFSISRPSSSSAAPSSTSDSSFDDDNFDDLDDDFNDVKPNTDDLTSLDDISTPGKREDWSKTEIPKKPQAVIRKTPPKWADLERHVQGVLTTMDIIDGFRLDYSRMSGNFTVSHAMSMGSVYEPPNYTFVTQYANQDIVLMGRVGTEGDFYGIAKKPINKWITVGMTSQKGGAQQPDVMTSFDADIKGSDNHTTLKMQYHNQSPILQVGYVQTVTPRLFVGVEGQLNIAEMVSVLSTGFSYKFGKNTLSSQLMRNPLGMGYSGHLNFARKVDDQPTSQITYATQLKVQGDPQNPKVYNTAFHVAWDYKFTLSSLRGHIDSNGKIYGMLEERISPFMGIVLGATADFWNNKYRIGFGLSISMPDLTEEQQRMMMAEQGIAPPGGSENTSSGSGGDIGDDVKVNSSPDYDRL